MDDIFAELAARHGLHDQSGVSPDQLPERYLYSEDMAYRYAFGRWWDGEDLTTSDVWVLLNPATGDTEGRRRPTLEKCITRSRADDRSGVVIVNLFAFRHTDPEELERADDPVGPANDDVLATLTAIAPRTVVAWGGGGRLLGRSRAVGLLLDQPKCLGITRYGEPRHPLYVRADAPLVPWQPPTA